LGPGNVRNHPIWEGKTEREKKRPTKKFIRASFQESSVG